MKKKTNIKQVIRTIVREEVAMAIQEVIAELKQPTRGISKSKPKVVEGKEPYKKYTDNAVINDILNETAQGDEWKKLSASDTINESFQKSYGDITNNNSSDSLAASMGVDPNDAPDFLTKDYSGLVKAMNKQPRGKIQNGAK